MKKAARVAGKGRSKSPVEKYRGIGTPGIGRGKKAVLRWVRELRGR